MTSKEMQKYSSEIQKQQQSITVPQEMLQQGHAMQQIRTDNITAISVIRPRPEPAEITRRVLAECKEWPEGLVYSFPVRGKDGMSAIEGASIKMANTLARVYGNCSTFANVINESASHWVFEGVFVDRETANEVKRLFIQRKPTSTKGRWELGRLEEASFQIGQSKALRNAIINAMPPGLVKAAIETAKSHLGKSAVKESGSIAETIEKIKRGMKNYCTLNELEMYLDKPVEQWGEYEIGRCRMLYTSFEEKAMTIEQFQTILKQRNEVPAGEASADAVADAIQSVDEDGVVQDV